MDEMKPKTKPIEPTLRAKLSQAFLEAFQSDFEVNGIAAIEQLRQKSPEKYSEIAARLIATTEPKQDGWNECQSMQEMALKLLKSVGLDEYEATQDQIEQAIEANNEFLAQLQAIRDRAHN
jgi:hypothetical protein